MSWSRLAAAAWLVSLVGPTAVSAPAPGPGAAPAGTLGAGREPMKAFGRLFDSRSSDALDAVQRKLRLRSESPPLDPFRFARPNSARRFICTMIVLPADPSLDPTFEKPITDRTTRFTLRVVPPSCS